MNKSIMVPASDLIEYICPVCGYTKKAYRGIYMECPNCSASSKIFTDSRFGIYIDNPYTCSGDMTD